MPVTRAVPPSPPFSVPVVDKGTGLITPAWAQWIAALLAFLAEVKNEVP